MKDNSEVMILLKGKPQTNSVASYTFDQQRHLYRIRYNNGGKEYFFNPSSVDILRNPKHYDPAEVRISQKDKRVYNLTDIYEFTLRNKKYYHLYLNNGYDREYDFYELQVEHSCLSRKDVNNRFEYLKAISTISNLTIDNEKILPRQYEKIGFVGENTALSVYLRGAQNKKLGTASPIFPFGCNKSQYEAVVNALENQMSVIQGPPGTGKTQTILNIIANLVVAGKTVQVVSNNNSAIENVLEKLSDPQYQLDFIVAKLGKSENKRDFLDYQTGSYPDFSTWNSSTDQILLKNEIDRDINLLKGVFDAQERVAV